MALGFGGLFWLRELGFQAWGFWVTGVVCLPETPKAQRSLSLISSPECNQLSERIVSFVGIKSLEFEL